MMRMPCAFSRTTRVISSPATCCAVYSGMPRRVMRYTVTQTNGSTAISTRVSIGSMEKVTINPPTRSNGARTPRRWNILTIWWIL